MSNQPDIGPFGRLLGFDIVAWEDGSVAMTMPIRPEHLNRSGVLHGGIVSALLDTACGYAGTWCSRPGHVRWAVTVSLTTHFVGQARAGVLSTTGRRRGGGRKIFMASAEVLDEAGQLIGFGDAVQRYRSGSESLEGIPYQAPAA